MGSFKSEYRDGKIIIEISKEDVQVCVDNKSRWNGCKVVDMDKLMAYIANNIVEPTMEDGDGDYSHIEKAIEDLAYKSYEDGEEFVELHNEDLDDDDTEEEEVE